MEPPHAVVFGIVEGNCSELARRPSVKRDRIVEQCIREQSRGREMHAFPSVGPNGEGKDFRSCVVVLFDDSSQLGASVRVLSTPAERRDIRRRCRSLVALTGSYAGED